MLETALLKNTFSVILFFAAPLLLPAGWGWGKADAVQGRAPAQREHWGEDGHRRREMARCGATLLCPGGLILLTPRISEREGNLQS